MHGDAPLHAILGYTELLTLDDRSSDDQNALDEIRANGEQLLYRVDDLIALASVTPDDFDGGTPLAPILDASIERLREARHGARVTFTHPDLSCIEIPASANRTGQLLYCALAAAMRSAPDIMLPLAPHQLADRDGVDYVRKTDAVVIELHRARQGEPELLAAGQVPSP